MQASGWHTLHLISGETYPSTWWRGLDWSQSQYSSKASLVGLEHQSSNPHSVTVYELVSFVLNDKSVYITLIWLKPWLMFRYQGHWKNSFFLAQPKICQKCWTLCNSTRTWTCLLKCTNISLHLPLKSYFYSELIIHNWAQHRTIC